jgi:predicted MFS family arabinose efflux permease
MLLFLTFALGLGATMNGPAWQAIMPELVPRAELPQAIALNSVGFNLARAVGPALGGLVVSAMGAGWAFMLNAVSFVAVLIVLYLWPRTPEHMPAIPESVGTAIWAGIRYVRFSPAMHAVLLRSGTFVISASALWAILPLVAKDELHSESSGYGVLLGCLGAGSILAAFLLSRIRHRLKMEQVVTWGIAIFGVVNLLLGVLYNFAAVALSLIVAGMAWMAVNSSLNTVAQQTLPAWVRARALSLYLLVFQGAMAVGSVIWGEVAERLGLRVTFVCAGLALLAGAAATARLRFVAPKEGDTLPSMHWPEPQFVIEPKPDHGPVLVTVEYFIDTRDHLGFSQAMQAVERIRRRDGAIQWGLFQDAASPGRYLESFLVESWAEHLRQHERMTNADRAMEAKAWLFHKNGDRPVVTHWIADG